MKVVFLEEVEGTARTGDVKNVANGFARNYLLPRKLAAPATKHYIAIAEQKATKEAKRQDRVDEEARERLLPLVEGQEMTIEVLVGEQGKLFGSVTSRDIAERLQKDTGVELEHRQVALNQPIREIGTHEVSVKLTRNVIARITVHVHPEGGMPEPEAEPEATETASEGEAGATEAASEDETTEAASEDETTEAASQDETAAEEPAAAEAAAAEAASEGETTEATSETAAEEPAVAEASADEPAAEEAAPAPEEETTADTSDAPDEATEDEAKGNASQDGS